MTRRIAGLCAIATFTSLAAGCEEIAPSEPATAVDQEAAKATKFKGRTVFRHHTFGNEQLWTDQLQMHVVISTAVDPVTALTVAGLKVDATAVPPEVLETADMSDPATTVALIGLDAVVGIQGEVDEEGNLVSVGITCALCHSTVDDSVAFGIGNRLDGWPNRDLDPGLIISLSPAVSESDKAILQSWGPGFYDPRRNIDGLSDPVLIPPAYGLADVALETYTGDGPISYWNAYVAITQMGGVGDFSDPRIGVFVDSHVDLVTPRLPALLEYQLTLDAPAPPPNSFDEAAAERGLVVFEGAGQCSGCHAGPAYTDAGTALHAAEETGMDPVYATRSATGLYRTTPLRALWQHAPYFHDGSAATLEEVVEHYDAYLALGLTEQDQNDLVEFLKSL
jgi:mono/diheme cytochrome c family protein